MKIFDKENGKLFGINVIDLLFILVVIGILSWIPQCYQIVFFKPTPQKYRGADVTARMAVVRWNIPEPILEKCKKLLGEVKVEPAYKWILIDGEYRKIITPNMYWVYQKRRYSEYTRVGDKLDGAFPLSKDIRGLVLEAEPLFEGVHAKAEHMKKAQPKARE